MTDELENGAAAAESTESTTTTETAPETAPSEDPQSLDDALSQQWDALHQPKQDRDEAGRFKAKAPSDDDGEAEPAQELDTAADEDGAREEGDPDETEALKPPSSWRKAAQVLWEDMDPRVQEEILKRERDAQSMADKARNEAQESLKRFEGLDEVLTANNDVFAARNMTPKQGVEVLISAQRMLDADPVQGVLRIAETYGIDLPSMFAGYENEGEQYEMNPDVAALRHEIADIRQHNAEFMQAQEAQAQEAMRAEMDAFADAHPYFDRVRDEMSRLVSIGAADTFEDAYSMAVARDPDIVKEEAEAAEVVKERAAKDKAKERTERARRATDVNVRSSTVTGRGKQSIDDTLNDTANRLFT